MHMWCDKNNHEQSHQKSTNFILRQNGMKNWIENTKNEKNKKTKQYETEKITTTATNFIEEMTEIEFSKQKIVELATDPCFYNL